MKAADVEEATINMLSQVAKKPSKGMLILAVQSCNVLFPIRKMKLGRDNAPNIKSANAILMIRKKLFLRRFLLSTKRTMVSKFPATMKMDVKIYTLHHAIPSALEGAGIDEAVAISELLLAADRDMPFILN